MCSRCLIPVSYTHLDVYKRQGLDHMIDIACDQLYDRFKIQSQKKVKNFPFLMGQGIWLDSDKLGPDDTIEEVIKLSLIHI